MPYYLSPEITLETKGQWFEGNAYEKENIYHIEPGKLPPVNYDKHILKPHSLTHAEGPRHTQTDGKTVDQFFEGNFLFGRSCVVRLPGDNFKLVDEDKKIYVWEIQKNEIEEQLKNLYPNGNIPQKILITVDNYPKGSDGYQDFNKVLILSQEAADYLISLPGFHLYGTSWKSTDFKPGSIERPIHNTVFQQAIIFECLDLEKVPQGEYFFVGAPIRLVGSSEAPVSPMLFTKDEILNAF